MFDRDFDEFAALLDGAISLNPNWKPIPAAGRALYFRAMEAYSLEQVRAALTAHIRDPKAGMFQPTPAHLIGHIDGQGGGDQRPGADEAWAIALTSRDEAETVIWTDEMAEAFAVCSPVLQAGDDVGARMAFKDAYNRLTAAARHAGKPAKWSASLGWDVTKREAVIRKAQTAGLLPAPTVQALLPNYSASDPDYDVFPEGLKRVKEVMAQLQDGWAKAAERRASERAAEREAEQRKKDEIAAKVAQYENVKQLKARA
jgi:hypothetical protein